MGLKKSPFSCNYVADEYLRNKGYRKLVVDNYIVFNLIEQEKELGNINKRIRKIKNDYILKS